MEMLLNAHGSLSFAIVVSEDCRWISEEIKSRMTVAVAVITCLTFHRRSSDYLMSSLVVSFLRYLRAVSFLRSREANAIVIIDTAACASFNTFCHV